MVIPRSRSMSIESSTCSTMSRSSIVCVNCSTRSASVDLPWSMCAMIEKLRMSVGSVMAAYHTSPRERRGRPSADDVVAQPDLAAVELLDAAETQPHRRRHAFGAPEQRDRVGPELEGRLHHDR